jgi:hypothetical protein
LMFSLFFWISVENSFDILKQIVIIKSEISYSGDCEECKFVGCNYPYVYSGRSLPMFLRSIVAPSSGPQITGRCIREQKRLFQILLNSFFTVHICIFRNYII